MFYFVANSITINMSTFRMLRRKREVDTERCRYDLYENRISDSLNHRIEAFFNSYRFAARKSVGRRDALLLNVLAKNILLAIDWGSTSFSCTRMRPFTTVWSRIQQPCSKYGTRP